DSSSIPPARAAQRRVLHHRPARARPMQTALRARLRVPEDLTVVGYDDIGAAATVGVPLTSVHVGSHDPGSATAELLIDENRPGHVHQRLVFPPRLVERNST